jgi:hypothetical protein
VCCCLSFLDFDLDLSLVVRFWFYRSHLFTNFRFSTVFISRSRARRLDSFWLGCFLCLRGIRVFFVFGGIHLGSWCFSLTPGYLVSFGTGVFWIYLVATLSLVQEFSPAHEKSLLTKTPPGPSSCRVVCLASPSTLSYKLIWLPPIMALHRLSLLLIQFLDRTDRVSSCTISSSARLLGFSVEILLQPRAGHPVRRFRSCP